MAIRRFAQHTPKVGPRVFIDRSAVVLGDVEIGEDSSVWPLTVIRGDMHRIRIGARTSVQDASVLHITHAGPFNPDGFPLLIGDDVTIGHKVMLHGCTLGNRIPVGMGCTIMDGAVVEDEVIIGAGSLVPRQTPGERLPVRRQPGQASPPADRQGTGVLYLQRRQLRQAQRPAPGRRLRPARMTVFATNRATSPTTDLVGAGLPANNATQHSSGTLCTCTSRTFSSTSTAP